MKIFFLSLIFFLLIINQGEAQKPFTKELGIYSDNDSYISLFNDGYYTNGLTFFYKFIPKSQDTSFPKKIIEYNLGIKMYTPRKGTAPLITDQDRPFAGYLYGKAFINYFYKNESFLKIGLSIGIVGPSSGGGDIQNSFHKLLGMYKIKGWEYQIQDLLALNAHFQFSKKIFRICSERIDLHAITEANLGTVETNGSIGFVNRLSMFPANKIYNSGIYGSLIDSKALKRSQRISEFFLFVKPMIHYRIYDATIQGSMFNDKSPVTYGIEPILCTLETGVIFQLYRVNIKYSVTFNGIEVLNDKVRRQTYGTIDISYIF